ncbi:hypothetical protein N657DRAFT_556059, partial [Parathielavia appendiculata]
MTTTGSIVKLTGPESWKEWNLRFINMAQDNQLWELIDAVSASKGDFMERPIEPKFANYPKLLDSPASSTRTASATLGGTPELVDTEGTPRNLSEMTTTGKEQYRQDVANFQFNWRRYETQGQRIRNVSNWVQKTVASHIYNATCKHDRKLHEWYAALKERAGTDTLADRSFVTFAGHTSDEEEHDSEPPRRSKQRSQAPLKKRNRSPAPTTASKRRYTEGATPSCEACDRKHSLEESWAAWPEIRPEHMYPSERAEGRAQERIDRDPELRKRVEQLRKRVK